MCASWLLRERLRQSHPELVQHLKEKGFKQPQTVPAESSNGVLGWKQMFFTNDRKTVEELLRLQVSKCVFSALHARTHSLPITLSPYRLLPRATTVHGIRMKRWLSSQCQHSCRCLWG